MGQQQLLLLVLGIVIVGLAVVAGIDAFSENQAKANTDAMVNDAVRIASDVQAWALKPTAFGGLGDENGAYNSVTFNDIGYQAAGGEYTNINGTYTLADDCSGGSLTAPTPGTVGGATPAVYVVGTSTQDNEVCVAVTGPNPENIATVTGIGSAS